MSEKCKICGKDCGDFTFRRSNSAIHRYIIKNHVCSECALWLTRKLPDNSEELVIDGKVYAVSKKRKIVSMIRIDNPVLHYTYILRLDTMTSEVYEQCIEIGTPPEHFRKPDNAAFITRGQAFVLKDGPFECQGKTCLDRYTCLFYMKEKVEGDAPATIIPEGWVDGSEKCKDYINISNANKKLLEWRNQRQ